jgi:C_GCAxxG_C_C family probable redox protein
MKKSDQINHLFQNYNCAQTIFTLFATDCGLDKDSALRIASGFGGGMNNGDTCGAITGAYMYIGLKYGHSTSLPGDKAQTSELIKKFNRLFLEEHPSLICKQLLGYNVSVPEQREIARQAGVFERNCPRFLQTAAKILENNF